MIIACALVVLLRNVAGRIFAELLHHALRRRARRISVLSRWSRPCFCTAAGCTSSATCCFSGPSARASKTPWGTSKFLAFYLLCGIAAGIMQVYVQLRFARSHGGRERRHRRRDGRVSDQVSARQNPHAGLRLHFHHHGRYPACVHSGLLVRHAVVQRLWLDRADAVSATAAWPGSRTSAASSRA